MKIPNILKFVRSLQTLRRYLTSTHEEFICKKHICSFLEIFISETAVGLFDLVKITHQHRGNLPNYKMFLFKSVPFKVMRKKIEFLLSEMKQF